MVHVPAALVLNAGSSSLKFALYGLENARLRLRGLVEPIGGDARLKLAHAEDDLGLALDLGAGVSQAAALAWLLDALRAAGVDLRAVGHRVVHGGHFARARAVDAETMDTLRALIPFAPLHQPHNLAAIDAVAQAWPNLSQVACFDTAFHQSIPEVARTYALPAAIRDGGVRRYGFHGLNYAHVADVLPDVLGNRAGGRVVVAHLGNGASLCGMVDRQSRATTMGFTPLDGLVMGTRPGTLDPGIVLYMLDHLDMASSEVGRLLNRESGLLGLSGTTADMRALLASDDPRAVLALDVFVHRCAREIAGIAAEIGGIDALVFTGGIGENAAPIRARIVKSLAWLGLALDARANRDGEARLAAADSRIDVRIVPADEETRILRELRDLHN